MRALALLAATLALPGADWTLYRSGSFEVATSGDKKNAREVLNHLEQLQWAFGQFTGKQEPTTPWPVRVLIGRDATSSGFRAVNDGLVANLKEKTAVPTEWNAALLELLIANNLGRMPASIESGLVTALQTVEVSGVHIIAGLAPQKTDLDWARMHLLITSEEYRGRVRVLMSNLEKGVDIEVAFRNSLGKSKAEIDTEAKAHLAGSAVPTADIPGKPINPNRDFTPREADAELIGRWTAATSAPDTAMGMVEASKSADTATARTLLEAASKKKPEWAEPYLLLSEIETDQGRRAGLMKRAATLSPRDSKLWAQFATLMMSYNRFADADKAWAAAERAASTTEEKEKIRGLRSGLVDQRAAADADAKREAQIAKERDIQRVKNESVARIREAEAKVNAGRELPPGTKVEQWWDDPKPDTKISGTLRRVDCIGKQLRLVIDSGGKGIQILVKDPSKLALQGASEASLGCGVQKARAVEVDYFSKTDPKLNTVGEAAAIRFP